MQTLLLPCEEAHIRRAAALLREGELVGFPTETVYGLGADATNPRAVAKIFAAKGRPADNPLITHIGDVGEVSRFCADIPSRAKTLMHAFWPGPLTLVLPLRPGSLPGITTAGLSTFAVRQSAHPVLQELIRGAGCPIAAPSANLSGRPSPTTAQHVYQDMAGRVPMILDGGACSVGLESTVVEVGEEGVTLLRPGGVTAEMLAEALGEAIAFARGIMEPLPEDTVARSPGMKHRHYAPNARMRVVVGEENAIAAYDRELRQGGKPCILASRPGRFGGRFCIDLLDKPAATLFAALRRADDAGATLIVFQEVPQEGLGLAVMNRALRAAGFESEEE